MILQHTSPKGSQWVDSMVEQHTTQIMVGLLEAHPGILSLTQRIDFTNDTSTIT